MIVYFTPKSDPKLFACPCGDCDTKPSQRLLDLLQDTRSSAGVPMHVTSGPRCPAYNKVIGGAKYSEHPDGDGADIEIFGSRNRFLVTKAALDNGCNRLGIAKRFLHLGVSETNDQQVIWIY